MSEWIKAAASGSSGNCIEMRRVGDLVQVRDSKDPSGPVLNFTGSELAAWLDGAKKNEFDHLV